MINSIVTSSARHRSSTSQKSNFILLYNPALSNKLCELEVPCHIIATILLMQISFWLRTKSGYILKDGRRWIYNSYDDWAAQIGGVSGRQIGKIIRSLRDLGFIETSQYSDIQDEFISPVPDMWSVYNRRTWITLNYEVCAAELPELSISLPKEFHSPKKDDRLSSPEPTSIYTEKSAETTTREVVVEAALEEGKELSLSSSSTSMREPNFVNSVPTGHEEDLRKVGEIIHKDQSSADAGEEFEEDEINTVNEEESQETPKKKVELPRKDTLKLLRVNVYDSGLLSVAAALAEISRKGLNKAIHEFIKQCETRKGASSIEKPTRYLVGVLKNFINDYKSGTLQIEVEREEPKEINPPTSDQIKQLEELKAKGEIFDFYYSSQDHSTKVVLFKASPIRNHMPWWEVLS